MQERGRGVLTISDDVVREAWNEVPHSPGEEPLAGGIFAIARAIGLDIQRQGQPGGAHDAEEREVMEMAGDGALGIPDGVAQPTESLLAATLPRAVNGKANEATGLKRLVALGAAHDLDQRATSGRRVEPFGEVGERIVAEVAGQGQRPPGRRVHQRLNGVEGPLPEHLANELGPEQIWRAAMRGWIRPSPGCWR